MNTIRHPQRTVIFRDEDLASARGHPWECFRLLPNDFIRRACDDFCRRRKMEGFSIWVRPFDTTDMTVISLGGSRLWGLPPWSLVMSKGSLEYYRGWRQAANFAHEFGHAITYDTCEFEADRVAAELIGKARILDWLDILGERHGRHVASARRPSINARIEALRGHKAEVSEEALELQAV